MNTDPSLRMEIPHQLSEFLDKKDPFLQIMQMDGKVFRDVPGRRTINVNIGGQSYFIKQHFGVGWKEILKNLLTFRLPILSALTEWRAIQKLNQIGIPTTPAVAYGCRGINPATLQSFLITRDLGDIVSLETFCATWPQSPPDAKFKRALILAVARMARTLHESGLSHRDFYICHFCLDNTQLQNNALHLYLIDLHRVGIRTRIPASARMKDLAALYFSAMDIGMTKRDYLRFLRTYSGNLHEVIEARPFWERVEMRAQKLYYKFHGVKPSEIAST